MGGTQSTETDGRTTVEHNRPKGSQSANNDKGTQSFKTDSGLDNCRPRTAANGDYSSDRSVESSDDYNKNKHDDKKKTKFIKCKEKFYYSDNGVFYDDGTVSIMFMMEKETLTSSGLTILFKNKTNFDISSVNFEAFYPEEALDLVQDTTFWNGGETLRENGVKRVKFGITCLDYFEKQSIFRVMFVRNNLSWKIQMNLPIYIHKFLAPVGLNKLEYQKWDKCLPNRREDVIRFQATKSFAPWLKKQLEDIGITVHSLEKFGVNEPEIEYVGTGKIYTKGGNHMCLLQLRHNMDRGKSFQEYRLMIRTSFHLNHFKSSEYILSILSHELWEAQKSCNVVYFIE